jgi:predicted acylesterase/phospholipase RssA
MKPRKQKDKRKAPQRKKGNVVRIAEQRAQELPAGLGDFDIPRILPVASMNIAYGRSGRRIPRNMLAENMKSNLSILSDAVENLHAGSRNADVQIRNVLASGIGRFAGSADSPPYDYGLVAAIANLGDGLTLRKECRNSIAGRVRALQATFGLDFNSDIRGIPLTLAANWTISKGLSYIGASGNLGQSNDQFGRGGVIAFPGYPWGPDGPLPGDPLGPVPSGGTSSFCDQLGDLIGQAYTDWAAGTDQDPYARLIGNVSPRCAAFDLLDSTEFLATPIQGGQFPRERPNDVRLMFGDLDITAQIDSWGTNNIAFHLRQGSRSASLYLQGPYTSRSGLSTQTLGRILDWGTDVLGVNVRNGAGISIGVIYRPEVKLFRINGSDVGEDTFVIEACHDSLQILWQVGLANTPGLGIPECARLQVDLIDDDESVLASSTVSAGRLTIAPGNIGEASISLLVSLTLNGTEIGNAHRIARIRREDRISLEMVSPNRPVIIGSQHGLMRVSVSCAAPAGGVRIEFQNSAPAILSTPSFIVVPEAETSVGFAIYSRPGEVGLVIITARAPGHNDGQIRINVLDPHTAVILSGGGSKGDFEVGSCSYLLQARWDELNVRTVVGTSVGSINTLGLAHNDGANTARGMEDTWLSMRKQSDMFRVADWIINFSRDTGFSPMDFINTTASTGGRFVLHTEWYEDVALDIPFLGRWLTVTSIEDLVNTTEDYLNGRKRADDGRLIAAASLFDLAPTAQQIAQFISARRIIDGGLNVRLCMVALNDGQVYHVDQRGHLLRNAAGNILDEPITSFAYSPDYAGAAGTPEEKLIAASLASSAIPFFFAPVRLSTNNRTLTMVDGGVRDYLPTRAAIDLGANLLVSIAAAPAEVVSHDVGRTVNLIDIAIRGIDIQGSEVGRANENELKLTPDRNDLELILIRPDWELHDLYTIDPSKIRINLSYGYMRAFDEFFRRENSESIWAADARTPDDCHLSTESIVQLRYTIWEVEEQFLKDMLVSSRPSYAGPSSRDPSIILDLCHLTAAELNELRALKRDLFQRVYSRFTRFGASSLPKSFGSRGRPRSERIFDWWESWEHIDPREVPSFVADDTVFSWLALSLPGRPFDPQIIWDQSTGNEMPEPIPPQPPTVPQDFALAMTF